MLISQGSFRVQSTVCKNHNVNLIIIANFVNFIEKTCYAVKSIEKINTFLNFHLGSSPGVPCAPHAYVYEYIELCVEMQATMNLLVAS